LVLDSQEVEINSSIFQTKVIHTRNLLCNECNTIQGQNHMKKRHRDKYQILPKFRRIMRPMMSVRSNQSSPSENGIVTSVVTASSLLESFGVTLDCCSKFEGKSWNERYFKESVLFSRIYFWHSRSERVIRTGIANCTRAFCTSRFCESAASILNSTCSPCESLCV